MITLSIRQPYASLICAGIKDVENRTWSTDYRGKLLIHASGNDKIGLDELPLPVFAEFFEFDNKDFGTHEGYYLKSNNYKLSLKENCKNNKEVKKEFLFLQKILRNQDIDYFIEHAIIGSVDLINVIKDSKSKWSGDDCYHWLLSKPVFFDKPITSVKGKLRLWNFNSENIPEVLK